MFDKIKDAYDKYILMDNRINELEERIITLEEIIKKANPSKFACRSCDEGTYRITNKNLIVGSCLIGKQWKCDKCGHIADRLQSQTLSKG